MKKIAIALIVALATYSPVLANDGAVKKLKTESVEQSERSARRPVLDTTVTNSLRKSPVSADRDKPQKRERVRSGIEVNPWIIPNFL